MRSDGQSEAESSPEGNYLPEKMRARGGSQVSGAGGLFAMNNEVGRMDLQCRKDLPSPRHGSGERGTDPKSPPKSVRFTEEDEFIEKTSAKKKNQVK
jgi:hypothetical protein